MLCIPAESLRTQHERQENLVSLYLFLLLSPALPYNELQTLHPFSVAMKPTPIPLSKIYRFARARQEFAPHALCQLKRLDYSADRTN